jgi:hypothetical protein
MNIERQPQGGGIEAGGAGVGPLMSSPQAREGDSKVLMNLRLSDAATEGLKVGIREAIRERHELKLPDVIFRVVAGQVTDSPRAIGAVEVLDKADRAVMGSYLVKRAAGTDEAAYVGRLRFRGKTRFAPAVVYSDERVIAEELVPEVVNLDGITVGTGIRDRGPYLSKASDEAQYFGERLADAVYRQVQAGVLWDVGKVAGRGDPGRIPDTHLRLIGRGRRLQPVFLDWSKAVDIGNVGWEGGPEEMGRADSLVKGEIMMLMGVVHRCLNDGPDAVAWTSFQRALVNVYPKNLAEGMYFRRLLDETRQDAINPKTWGQDEQVAGDWDNFYQRVYEAAAKGAVVEEKPVEDRTRCVRDLTSRNIPSRHAEAVVDFLEGAVEDGELFRRLNFKLSGPEAETGRGQGILSVMAPEPERKELFKIRLAPVASRENALLAYRASEEGVGTPVLHVDVDSQVEVVASPNMKEKVGEMSGWGDGEKAFRSVGSQLAVMLSRMMAKNMMMDKERLDLADSLVISGGGADDVSVALAGWDGRVNLERVDTKKRDTLIREYMGMVLNVCRNARENGTYVWYEFETTLSKRARRTERKELYEWLREEFKYQSTSYDPSLQHFFHEAMSVGPAKRRAIPPELGERLVRAGSVDAQAAWNRLQDMGAPSPEQVRSQGQGAEEASGAAEARRREFLGIAANLVETMGRDGLDPDESVRELRRVGTIYDEASATVMSRRTAVSERTEAAMGDKMDVYRRIQSDGAAIKALTDQRLRRLADILSYRSAYLAKTMIELIAERPQSLNEVVKPEHRPTTLEGMRGELGRRLAESAGEGGEEGRRRGVDAVRHFNNAGLIRLGYMYTEVMEGKLTDTTVRGIYDEMSDLSIAVLEGVYSLERRRMSEEYGEPSAKAAIVLAGANSRREFPSFHVDAAAVTSPDDPAQPEERGFGLTSGGSRPPITNLEYHEELTRRIRDSAKAAGHLVDFDTITLGPEGRALNCRTPAIVCGALDAAAAAEPAVLFGAENLTYGCGDPAVAGEMLEASSRLIGRHAPAYASAVILDRENRDKEWRAEKPNIKYSKGGLHDLVEVVDTYKAVEGLPQNSIFDLVGAIYKGLKSGAEPAKAELLDAQEKQLMKSYLWLMNLRVRLDLEYGRQHKFLPEDAHLRRFVRMFGYADQERDPVEAFMEDYETNTRRVREATDDLLRTLIERHPPVSEALAKARSKTDEQVADYNREEELKLRLEGWRQGAR